MVSSLAGGVYTSDGVLFVGLASVVVSMDGLAGEAVEESVGWLVTHCVSVEAMDSVVVETSELGLGRGLDACFGDKNVTAGPECDDGAVVPYELEEAISNKLPTTSMMPKYFRPIESSSSFFM